MDERKRSIGEVFSRLPMHIKAAIENGGYDECVEEIRLRVGLPLCITVGAKSIFFQQITVKKEDVFYCVRRFCNESVYSHISQINSGFIAGPTGCRVGVAGNFGGENAVDYTALNIRIAREIQGAANRLVNSYNYGGVLIAGPPGCGKTTVLRDTVRQLSNGGGGKSYRISVIDSRGEITGSAAGVMDTGKNTDIFLFCDKAFGIEAALRTFSPEIICFDEIGTTAEFEAVKQSMNAGADIITTAHAREKADFKRREVLKNLLLSGAVKTVVLMHGRNLDNAEFFESEELTKCFF